MALNVNRKGGRDGESGRRKLLAVDDANDCEFTGSRALILDVNRVELVIHDSHRPCIQVRAAPVREPAFESANIKIRHNGHFAFAGVLECGVRLDEGIRVWNAVGRIGDHADAWTP